MQKTSDGKKYYGDYSTSSKFSGTGTTISVTAGKSAASKTISGLAQTTYYVRVLPYINIDDTMYYLTKSGTARSVYIKSGLSIKERINRINTSSNSGKKLSKTSPTTA
ncbi:MAG: hypothetical protein LUG95_02185 [Clostridiales bacterium]|nr:hypothetical protein [Clostridiales bacterium]